MKRFKIKAVHVKGGIWGGAIGTVFVLLAGMLSPILIVLGGFFGIFIVRKEIRLKYTDGLKIGLISATVASLYTLFLYYRMSYPWNSSFINAAVVFIYMIGGALMGIVIFVQKKKKMH